MDRQSKENKGPEALSLEEMEQVTGGALVMSTSTSNQPSNPKGLSGWTSYNRGYKCNCGFSTSSHEEANKHEKTCKKGWLVVNGVDGRLL